MAEKRPLALYGGSVKELATGDTLPGMGGGGALSTPTGTINGSNTVFTLASAPTGDILVFLNGLAITKTTDYSVSGSTLTLAYAPLTGDILQVLIGAAIGGGNVSADATQNGEMFTLGTAGTQQFALRGRDATGSGSICAPYFQTTTNNAPTAFDVMPKGTVPGGAGAVPAWMDILDRDISAPNSQDWESVKLAFLRASNGYVGTDAGGTGTRRAMYIGGAGIRFVSQPSGGVTFAIIDASLINGSFGTLYLSQSYDVGVAGVSSGVARITTSGGVNRGDLQARTFSPAALTVDTLPSAATVGNGTRGYVTDATLVFNGTNIGSAATGGGGNHSPVVVVNGAWVIG